VRVYVVWATVLENDVDPPTADISGLLKDGRVQQYWDPARDLSAMVRAAADSGMTAFHDFKTGGHMPYDMAIVYKAGAHWVERIPKPLWVGSPVATAIPDLNKQLAAASARAAH
jgi:hypothetical protein